MSYGSVSGRMRPDGLFYDYALAFELEPDHDEEDYEKEHYEARHVPARINGIEVLGKTVELFVSELVQAGFGFVSREADGLKPFLNELFFEHALDPAHVGLARGGIERPVCLNDIGEAFSGQRPQGKDPDGENERNEPEIPLPYRFSEKTGIRHISMTLNKKHGYVKTLARRPDMC